MNKITSRTALVVLSILFLTFTGCKSTHPILKMPDTPPVIEEPKKNIVISYNVEPKEFYKDKYGYIGLGYETRAEKWKKLKTILKKRGATDEDFKKAEKLLPKEGMITIHIGRQDIHMANTERFSFSIEKDGKVISKHKGKKGIPNIKGRDGNWWNLVEIPLNEKIKDQIKVIATNNKTATDFVFFIIKEETVIQ